MHIVTTTATSLDVATLSSYDLPGGSKAAPGGASMAVTRTALIVSATEATLRRTTRRMRDRSPTSPGAGAMAGTISRKGGDRSALPAGCARAGGGGREPSGP